jgi:hypothetical protein
MEVYIGKGLRVVDPLDPLLCLGDGWERECEVETDQSSTWVDGFCGGVEADLVVAG